MCLNDSSGNELDKIKKNSLEEKSFRKALSRILLNPSANADKPLLIGITPNAIDCCTNNKGLNLTITKKVIRKCMKDETRDEEGRQTKKSGHGLSEQQLNDTVWSIKRPVMIIEGSHPNTLAVMTDCLDDEHRYIFVFISLNQAGATSRINVVSSIYGRNNIADYIERCITDNKIIAINKEKVNAVCLSIGVHFSKATALINFDNTIAYSLKSVKENS